MTFPREGIFTSGHFFASKDVMGNALACYLSFLSLVLACPWLIVSNNRHLWTPPFPQKNILPSLPFVQIHSGNNSKIVFLCICICYEMKIISKIILYLLCGPLKAAKNSCVCIC